MISFVIRVTLERLSQPVEVMFNLSTCIVTSEHESGIVIVRLFPAVGEQVSVDSVEATSPCI